MSKRLGLLAVCVWGVAAIAEAQQPVRPVDSAGTAVNGTVAAAGDDAANPTLGRIISYIMCFDGTTWDRCRSATTTEATHATTLGTITAVVGNVLMGNASTATPTDVGADGDAAAIWLNRNGAVNTVCISGCGSGTVYDHGEAVTLSTANGVAGGGRVSAAAPSTTGVVDDDFAVHWMLNTGAAVTQPSFAGILGVAGSGVNGTGVQRVTIATDDEINDDIDVIANSYGTAGSADSQVVSVQGITSMTPLQVQTDSAQIATEATATNILTSANYAAAFGTAGTPDSQVATVQGAASMTPILTQPQAIATGGASSLKYTSAGATEDEHAVMTGAGTLYSITVTNTNAAARYLRCENDTAANTTPGSETPELDLAIPGATSGAGFTTTFPVGVAFSTALTCWVVTGAADTDVAEVAANEIKIFYTFKQ